MKKIFAVFALALMVGCAAQKPTPTPVPPPVNKKDFTVTVTFNYDFTNFAVCSSTVTTGCVTGFTWGYMRGATQVPLKSSLASICTGSAQPESCTDTVNSLVGFGPVVPYVAANGIDNTGAATSSPSTGASVQIALGAPTNVIETFK